MTSDKYVIEVSGDGVAVKQEVTKEIGDQIIVLMLTGSAATTASTPRPAAPQQPTVTVDTSQNAQNSLDLSIRETLDASGAKRAPDRITVIGDYIKRTENRDFDRNDVVAMFEAAAEKVPGNLARDIKWTLKAGWITERSGTKGMYYVTNTGIQALKASFSDEFVKRTRQSPGKKTKA